MATLSFENIKSTEQVKLTDVTLSSSDTFTLPTSGSPYIVLSNGSGGSITATFTGEGVPITKNFGGYGDATFNNLSVTVADGEVVSLYLTSYKELLQGDVTLVGENLTALLFTA